MLLAWLYKGSWPCSMPFDVLWSSLKVPPLRVRGWWEKGRMDIPAFDALMGSSTIKGEPHALGLILCPQLKALGVALCLLMCYGAHLHYPLLESVVGGKRVLWTCPLLMLSWAHPPYPHPKRADCSWLNSMPPN